MLASTNVVLHMQCRLTQVDPFSLELYALVDRRTSGGRDGGRIGFDAPRERECAEVAQCSNGSCTATDGRWKRRKQGSLKYHLIFRNSETSCEGVTGEKEIVYLKVSMLHGTAEARRCTGIPCRLSAHLLPVVY